jgi:Na+/H+ antiporter NhaD/arsenite permease-like protein
MQVLSEASEALSDVSEVIFFLIGAMTIVEVVDSHQVSPCHSMHH